MSTSLLCLLVLAVYFKTTRTCGFQSQDSQVVTDPTMTFSVSPPVRWTYYPPITPTSGTTIANYFPGQSTTSEDAVQAAENDIQSAFLEALASSNYPTTTQATASVTYSPDQISNCYIGQPIASGTRIGYLAGGTITQTSLVSGTSVTATQCPLSQTTAVVGFSPYEDYIKEVTVSTRGGLVMSRYNWERITNEMQSILNFRFRVLFRTAIIISS